HGPHISNCAGMAGDLAAAGASETVSDGDALAHAISTLLANRHLRAERVAAGRRVVAAGQGILDAVSVRLAPWLDPLAPMESAVGPLQCLPARRAPPPP